MATIEGPFGALTSMILVQDSSSDAPYAGEGFLAVDYAVECHFDLVAPIAVSYSPGVDRHHRSYPSPVIGCRLHSIEVIGNTQVKLIFDENVLTIEGGSWNEDMSFRGGAEWFSELFLTVSGAVDLGRP